MKKLPQRESDIVASCLEYFVLKNIFAFRCNTGALRTERGGFVRFGHPGAPDIFLCIKGRLIGIECKTLKGRQSPSQIAFQHNLEKAGGRYLLVRDVQDLIDQL